MKNQLVIRDISLAGILMTSIIILNLLFSLFPIIMGYTISFFILPFSFGLIILKSLVVRSLFLLFTPLILIVAPNIFLINIWQGFVEYFLAIWCFFPLLFGGQIYNYMNNKNYNKRTGMIAVSMIFIFCWMVKLLLHIIAGYFWWTNGNWVGSFLINWPIILFNILFTIPIFIIIFSRTITISSSYYLNNWNA
ncbi:MAG: hypothetical protein ACRCW3_03110 [Metamycoplasmataceae bacterium]